MNGEEKWWCVCGDDDDAQYYYGISLQVQCCSGFNRPCTCLFHLVCGLVF